MDCEIDLKGARPGIILLTALIHFLSQGYLSAQANTYFFSESYTGERGRYNSSDPLFLKLFVGLTMLMALLQTAEQGLKAYQALVITQTVFQTQLRWTAIFFNGSICSLVEGFLVYRCWKVAGKSYLALVPLIMGILVTLAASLYLTISSAFDAMSLTLVTGSVAFSVWIFGSTVLDVTITSILLVFLLRSRTGFSHLDAVVAKISMTTWECGVLPMLSMVVALGVYYGRYTPDREEQMRLVVLFLTLTGKLYAHSLLWTLNARPAFRASVSSRPDQMGRRETLSGWLTEEESSSQSNHLGDLGGSSGGPGRQNPRRCIKKYIKAITGTISLSVRSGLSTLGGSIDMEKGLAFRGGGTFSMRSTPPVRSVTEMQEHSIQGTVDEHHEGLGETDFTPLPVSVLSPGTPGHERPCDGKVGSTTNTFETYRMDVYPLPLCGLSSDSGRRLPSESEIPTPKPPDAKLKDSSSHGQIP